MSDPGEKKLIDFAGIVEDFAVACLLLWFELLARMDCQASSK